MRLLALLPPFIAVARAASNGSDTGCPEGIGTDTHDMSAVFRQFRTPARNDRHAALIDRLDKRASGQAFVPYSTQGGQCMDVQNAHLASGSRVQLWQCSGGPNQAWRIEGPLVQTGNDMCLDVPSGNAYNGAPLQVWQCAGDNPNQHWSQIGSTLQWQGQNGKYCVDVPGGNFNNGQMLQLWTCYPGSANQAFVMGQAQATGNAPQGSSASTGATSFYGYNCIGLDEFVQKYPYCAPYKGALQSAGADQGINPVFLGSIAMIESTCGEGLKNSPHAWAGPFQFMDNNAADFYVGKNRDRTNFWDAAYGSARYFRALITQNNGNLFQAMRNYNGLPENGGDPNYQSHCAAFMGGYA